MRESVALMFRLQGFEVLTADSVKSGREAIAANTDLSCVLTDLQLGDESGLDVIRFCRAGYPLVRVVLYSGVLIEDISREAIEAGAVACFSKPFDIKALSAALAPAQA